MKKENKLSLNLRLVFKGVEELYIKDLSYFLYNFQLLFEFAVLNDSEEYKKREITTFFWKGKNLRREHQMRISHIQYESPLILGVILPIITGVGSLITIVETIWNFRLKRKNIYLEIEKKEREIENLEIRKRIDIFKEELLKLELKKEEWAFQKAMDNENKRIFERLVRKLEKSPLILEEMEPELFI